MNAPHFSWKHWAISWKSVAPVRIRRTQTFISQNTAIFD